MPVYQQARPDRSSQATLGHFPTTSHVSLSERLEHFTWAWFTAAMSTGNLAVVLANLPFRFRGLDEIGLAIYILDLVILLLFGSLILHRFIRFPWTLKASFLHPTESLYVAAGLLSLATIIVGGKEYGVKMGGFAGKSWFADMLRVCFWCYAALALAFTVAIHMTIWTTQTYTVDHMTPLWIMPIYPLLLVGPMAGSIAPLQTQSNAWDIFLAGLSFQGIGFMIAVMIYSAYISRLMTAKLPMASARPGMFVSVGPSAFTVVTFIKLGAVASHALPSYLFHLPELHASHSGPLPDNIPDSLSHIPSVVRLGFILMAIWLWGLALWFFMVSSVGNLRLLVARKLHFSLGWWSFVFPNTAFVLATLAVGNAVESKGLKVLGTALTVVVVALWCLVFGGTVRGVYKKEVLWPDQGEDRNEGGFKGEKRSGAVRRKGVPGP